MNIKNMTPKEIVAELDKYIIGQDEAKKSVAIALRNRYRRNQLSDEMREEITPKNILMMGPTGVGKTEIARRLARIMEAPFIKVEATKYTEVGYVGRDVESMIRDLVEASVRITKQKHIDEKYDIADQRAEDLILEALVPDAKKKKKSGESSNPFDFILNSGGYIGNIFGDMMPKKTKHKKLPVKEARKILREQEAQSMLDMDQVVDEALMNAEQNGIVFIDEIDKIASGSSVTASGEVSREGVQRDILPIVEGSVVNTKHGPVKTDHMLFIGAGAFHVSKPSDLIPELQGRFPIKVELKNLDKEAFKQILTVPENAVIKQQKALLETEGVQVEFTDDAIDEIAGMAFLMNEETENIGARRLYTIMETLLEDVSYELPNPDITHVLVDREMVQEKFKEKIREVDVDKYIL